MFNIFLKDAWFNKGFSTDSWICLCSKSQHTTELHILKYFFFTYNSKAPKVFYNVASNLNQFILVF